jgi:hypothetical protein
VHGKTGELISWEKYGEPAQVSADGLKHDVSLLAACCLLLRYWPTTGSGCHGTALTVGGFLARAGFDSGYVRKVIYAIALQRPDICERADELGRTAEDHAKGHEAGKEAVRGFPQFAKAFGDDVATEIAEWLEYGRPEVSTDPEDWPEPVALPSGLLKVPTFNPHMLPEKIQPWLQDVAELTQVPLDFPAVAAMTVFGSVIGCRVGLRPKMEAPWVETLISGACLSALRVF